MNKKILFSGIQPSGVLHIGNYLGAIKQWVELQDSHEAFFCVVDEHAITVPQEPEELRRNTLNTAMVYLAAGIDPEKSTIFVQSHVPAHAELGWILNTITPLGDLERMTQFKDKTRCPRCNHSRKEHEKGELAMLDQFKGKPTPIYNCGVPNCGCVVPFGFEEIDAGLLNYPVLMAADILLYQTDVVPVGEDQQQHIELARSLAKRFNNRLGETFRIPEGFIPKETARIMGLDNPTKKMSKSAASANNYIALLDEPDEIRRKIKIAVTDSGKEVTYDEEKKPAISNLMRIFGAFSGTSHQEIKDAYAGKSYADFKNDLAELLVEKLAPLQKKYHELARDKKQILGILDEGAERANNIAQKTLHEAQQKIGFLLSEK